MFLWSVMTSKVIPSRKWHQSLRARIKPSIFCHRFCSCIPLCSLTVSSMLLDVTTHHCASERVCHLWQNMRCHIQHVWGVQGCKPWVWVPHRTVSLLCWKPLVVCKGVHSLMPDLGCFGWWQTCRNFAPDSTRGMGQQGEMKGLEQVGMNLVVIEEHQVRD